MNKVLILTDKVGKKGKALALGTSADIAAFKNLFFLIKNSQIKVWVNGKDIKSYEIVYTRRAEPTLRSAAESLALCLDKFGISYFDRAYTMIGAIDDKFTSYLKLAIADLPVIPTAFCMRSNIENSKGLLEKEIGFPMVTKELDTDRGIGVSKIPDYKEMEKLPVLNNKGITAQYLFQKYVNLVREFRLLVLGNKVVLVNENIITKKGEFRHNASLGATYEYLNLKDVPKEMIDIAVKAAKAVNLQVAGVDIGITDKGKYYLLEVNRGPGFAEREIEELSVFFNKILKYRSKTKSRK